MHDVICIGSALLDIFLKSDKFGVSGNTMGVEYGGKTEVNEVEVSSGGAGTNNAVSFARKGFSTALVAEVGRDLVAATIKEELVREKVDLAMLSEVVGEETGLSSILVTPDGGRSALIYRGASKMLTKEDINWGSIQAKWLMISSLGGEMPLLEGLIGHARTYGIKVAVNPGKLELERIKEWGGVNLFNGIEVLILNREEAALLMGTNFESDDVWRGEWWIPGPKYVVVTDGKDGGVVLGEGQKRWFEAEKVTVVEETGAGDAFGSGIVAALMQGKDIDTAINWGKKQAASVVSFMGAKKGLLRLTDLV
jgi:ribokinase